MILLRHGRTAWNAERRFQGHADPPLDEVGRVQAWEVAAIVATLRPGLLVSSSATRAIQTAAIVGEVTQLSPVTDLRFRERGLGHWEGLTIDEVSTRYPDEYAQWSMGVDVDRPGGESRMEVAERAVTAFAELPTADLTVLVTHGATAMAMCNALLGIDQSVHPLGPLANCHWSELVAERAPGDSIAWRLRGHNLGAPGAVIPRPAQVSGGETSDADA